MRSRIQTDVENTATGKSEISHHFQQYSSVKVRLRSRLSVESYGVVSYDRGGISSLTVDRNECNV